MYISVYDIIFLFILIALFYVCRERYCHFFNNEFLAPLLLKSTENLNCSAERVRTRYSLQSWFWPNYPRLFTVLWYVWIISCGFSVLANEVLQTCKPSQVLTEKPLFSITIAMWTHSTMTNNPNANMLAEYRKSGKEYEQRVRREETLYHDVLGVNLPCVRGFWGFQRKGW